MVCYDLLPADEGAAKHEKDLPRGKVITSRGKTGVILIKDAVL